MNRVTVCVLHRDASSQPFPALEAVIRDALRNEAKATFIAGDLASGEPFPDEVIRKVKQPDAIAIGGKKDQALSSDRGKSRRLAIRKKELIEWTAAHLFPDRLQFFSSLPNERNVVCGGLRFLMSSKRRANPPIEKIAFPVHHSPGILALVLYTRDQVIRQSLVRETPG